MKTSTQSNRPSLGLLSVGEAAEYLGISPRSIRRHASSGDLPHRRVGWLLKFEPTCLDDFAIHIGTKGKGRRP
ncbi:helix-turn-helix domain-containing protein [Haloferula sp.]|uniref:helix-turn-helix domain-containing protein n=1 Tax=Haloferula sp. TaxID=2497595 RepID=UPI003C728307